MFPLAATIIEALDIGVIVSLVAGAYWLGGVTRDNHARLANLETWQATATACLAQLTAHTGELREYIAAHDH